MLSKAQEIITKARANVFLDHGFFGHMLAKHEIHYTNSVPTLAVDNARNIYINPSFVMRFEHDNRKLQWALCHEVMHPVLMHLTRRGKRDPKMWNYAGDAVINDLLNSTGVGKPIEGTVNMPGSSAKTTEEVYNELQKNPPPPPSNPQPGSPCDSGSSSSYDNGLGDDIIEDDSLSESEAKELEARARSDMAEAAAAAKVRGKLTGALKQFVDSVLESKIHWYDKLHEYMQGLQRGDYSWTRPNRRFISQGHYLPSSGVIPKMGTIVIQVDISGSVTKTELRHFGAHVIRIVSECQPESIHILYTDTRVKQHDTFDRPEDMEFRFMSAGGTDMGAGIRYCETHGIEPDVFITLSDGETPWGDAPAFPCVWCLSRRHTPSHGLGIHFSVEE